MPSDRDLVLRILQGVFPAVETLLDRYKARIENWARAQIRRSLDGRVDPGDVIQDFYMKVCGHHFRALSQWQGVTDPSHDCIEPYFAAILKNVVRDKFRRAYRDCSRQTDWDDDGINVIVDPGMSQQQSTLEEELRAALWRCIAGLSDKLRQVLELHIEDLPHREIAQMLAINAGACRARLKRAIAALAGCMREAGHNDMGFGDV